MKTNKLFDYLILGAGAAVVAIIQQVITEKEIDARVENVVEERFTKEVSHND